MHFLRKDLTISILYYLNTYKRTHSITFTLLFGKCIECIFIYFVKFKNLLKLDYPLSIVITFYVFLVSPHRTARLVKQKRYGCPWEKTNLGILLISFLRVYTFSQLLRIWIVYPKTKLSSVSTFQVHITILCDTLKWKTCCISKIQKFRKNMH